MKYDFDKHIERRDTGCVKWDEMTSPDVIPLWVADMDFAVAPAIQEAIRKRAEHPVFGYTYVQDDYYKAVISWFKRRHQWDIQRDWILYTTGVVPAMSVAIKALTMPGEKVLILSLTTTASSPASKTMAARLRSVCCDSVTTATALKSIGNPLKPNVLTRRQQSFCSAILITPQVAFGLARNWSGCVTFVTNTTCALFLTRFIANSSCLAISSSPLQLSANSAVRTV